MAVPKSARNRLLTSLRERLVRIGAKVTLYSKSVTIQLVEVAVPQQSFATILNRSSGWRCHRNRLQNRVRSLDGSKADG